MAMTRGGRGRTCRKRAGAALVLALLWAGLSASAIQAQEPTKPAQTSEAGTLAEPAAPDTKPPGESSPDPSKSATRPEDLAWTKGKVKIIPFGFAVCNVAYNTASLFPGSYALYANPHNAFNQTQFEISPQNTLLGVDIIGPKVGDAQTAGRIDFDFRGPQPVETNAAPYFFDIYGEIKSDCYRFLLGQAADVIAPLNPSNLNFYTAGNGYGVGNLGFFRAQVRGEVYVPVGECDRLIFQGCMAQQVVPVIQPGAEVFGQDAGWPDLQGRAALGLGPEKEGHRPFEAGLSAHIGERTVDVLAPQQKLHFQTWSVTGDLRVELTERTGFQGELFMGRLLGSYNGGINQGINLTKRVAIRSRGGWVEVWHRFSDKLTGHLGYGIDDPDDDDLSAGERSLNTFYYANLYCNITEQLQVGLEFSWWETRYVTDPDNRALRIETAVIYRF
jgi:hypothetical protein